MFIAFNEEQHCAPSERYVSLVNDAINIVLLWSKDKQTKLTKRCVYWSASITDLDHNASGLFARRLYLAAAALSCSTLFLSGRSSGSGDKSRKGAKTHKK